jgi:BirA family transcriptional regulator, biotin operon repressor / biotin---[acetyl-CoA-carboxylase] ligase
MCDAPTLPPFFRIVQLATIDSTSEEAKRLSQLGAEEGTLVWAEQQTDGHGRFGRSWISPSGNLYFSLLLRPGRPPAQTMQLTFAAAVALSDAIETLLPEGAAVTCKWPNDVLVKGSKIAGILLESSIDAAGVVDSLVIGIGVNVASHPPADAVMYPATSLAAEGSAGATPDRVLTQFCPSFLDWYGRWQATGFAPLRQSWLDRAEKLQKPVTVRLDTETVNGIFAGLDESGAMILQQGDHRRLILAGDVFPQSV